MPRAVVITKLDQARADYDGVLAQAQAAFGDKVMPLYVPVRADAEVVGADRPARALRRRHDDLRGDLIEGVIEESEDETLMDRYLGGEEIDAEGAGRRPRAAVARATFFPVVPVCSVTGVGCAELLDLAVTRLPVAAEHPSPEVFTPAGAAGGRDRPATPTGPLVAEVVKTTSDPYVGRLSLVRVFSGTLVPDAAVHVSGHFTSFFGAETGPRGPRRGRAGRRAVLPLRQARWCRPTPVVAGDIVRDRPAHPRRDRRHPLRRRRPAGAAAVVDARAAAAGRDRGRTARPTRTSSPRRWAGSPPRTRRLRIENNAETHQLVLWCMGEAHADVMLERLAERYSRPRRPGAVRGVAARDVRRPGDRATAGT